ncbi:hypothetical protein P691DRAFT_801186 [Macrolepiota fuliginosa MF-IS2]|uniref:Thioesterase domain-containing protein n=1 Tax=Macrolepiota fuliginosa MF-IS2 TaxID=1400762 RepID=A0A9P6C697_9AGAR|nr:hypothetical protein P691DRAFT_801186 [Macrolepiota fuliginosa MF-IS2]
MSKLVHLVYIHGFQGNDTTFQSFPLDLQNHLSSHIPQHLDIKIQSSLYPTYKSVKPLSYAAKNFLEWLQTQPPGPVILMGHSMGGLLAAEAATDPSNTLDERTGRPRRIVGLIAFDTPYLGMHPHVIISGIASLLPKDTGTEGKKSEGEMNVHPDITVVPERVTDDWEAVKRSAANRSGHTRSDSDGSSHLAPIPPPSPSSSKHSSSRSSQQSPSPLLDRVLNFASAQSNSPFARWVKKHSDDPLSAGKRWIVERSQFSGAMFDPTGLKERYVRLVNWKHGMWVNYWTQTLPRRSDGTPLIHEDEESKGVQAAYNNYGLVESGIIESPAGGSSLSEIDREWTKVTEKPKTAGVKSEVTKGKVKDSRHFIVLPTGMGRKFGGEERWEKVVIGGVEDEVAAHCGLFIRGQNLDYDELVERVGTRVINWCAETRA